jgi:hypothetical protein
MHSSHQFKVGDRVKVVATPEQLADIGILRPAQAMIDAESLRVVEVDGPTVGHLTVLVSLPDARHSFVDYWVCPEMLELVSTSPEVSAPVSTDRVS